MKDEDAIPKPAYVRNSLASDSNVFAIRLENECIGGGVTSPVVKTLPGAPNLSGYRTSVPKLYLHEMQRNNASRSPTPATQKGRPCKTISSVL